MNHQKIYESIIQKARSENRFKLKKTNANYVYYENHHIVPKCMNGTNEKENLVLLTAKEHYVCHKLLTYIYPKNYKLACAFSRMTFDKQGRHNISSRDYAYARELRAITPMPKETIQKLSNSKRGKKTGKPAWNRGKKMSKNTLKKLSLAKKGTHLSLETRLKQSKSLKGKNKGMFLAKDKEDNLYYISNKDIRYTLGELCSVHKNKKHSEESKKKMSVSHTGLKRSEESKKKQSNSTKGKKYSDETIRKMSNSAKNRKNKK